jgi:hypothetical protein
VSKGPNVIYPGGLIPIETRDFLCDRQDVLTSLNYAPAYMNRQRTAEKRFGLVTTSRFVGSDLRAWQRLWTDYGELGSNPHGLINALTGQVPPDFREVQLCEGGSSPFRACRLWAGEWHTRNNQPGRQTGSFFANRQIEVEPEGFVSKEMI